MSGPYDQYNQYNQYNQGYSQGYNQGYPPQQGGYPPQQGYDQYSQQSQYPEQGFAPPRRADSFGPPQHGGFQHGQSGWNMGGYNTSNPQGHSGYYGQGQQYAQPGGNDAFAQNQAYQSSMSQQGGSQYQDPPQIQPQSSDPNAPNYDPNAPPMTEQDRGLLGALGGGWAGHKFGKQQGHGFLGTLAGAITGSMLEDKVKEKKKHHHKPQSNSSWGGSGYGRY